MSTKQRRHQIHKRLQSALSSMDPYQIASAVDLPPLKNKKSYGESSNPKTLPRSNSSNFKGITIHDANGVEWTSILSFLLEASEAALSADAIQCYNSQSSLHSSLNQIFSSSQGNILVPALHVVCYNTYQCALQADDVALTSGGRNDHSRLQKAVTLLQESFSKTLNDRKEITVSMNVGRGGRGEFSMDGSKIVGVLSIVNWLFAMYFRLNTLRLCKNLLRPVESKLLHEKGTMGGMVTYRYYVGRLKMFEDQYKEAEDHLDFALQHCHVKAIGNKKRILNYLLPVKLLRGRLPTDKLLQKYSLNEFKPLVEGIRKGDLRTFNDGLQKYQDLFIRRGTYLLLEKCKIVCYRNLCKRVWTIMQRPQLRLDHIVKSLVWLGAMSSSTSEKNDTDNNNNDLDEVECILANLIFRGYVRGYISHSKRILVLSKKDPFPKSVVIPK